MLVSAEIMLSHQVEGKDGTLGKVKDIYFDSQAWAIRYIAVDTLPELSEKAILVPARLFNRLRWQDDQKWISTSLKRDIAESIPHVDLELPLTREQELKLFRHFQQSNSSHVSEDERIDEDPDDSRDSSKAVFNQDIYLKNFKSSAGLDIHATDSKVGSLDDFIIDTESWTVSNIVLDTKDDLLPSRKISISPAWVVELDWKNNRIHLDQTGSGIQNFPDFDPTAPVNRENESTCYDYYGRLNSLI